jgi:hypothetical protein
VPDPEVGGVYVNGTPDVGTDVDIVPRSPERTTAAIVSSVPVKVAVIDRVVDASTTDPVVGDRVNVGVGVGVGVGVTVPVTATFWVVAPELELVTDPESDPTEALAASRTSIVVEATDPEVSAMLRVEL